MVMVFTPRLSKIRTVPYRADKGWAVKRARSHKKGMIQWTGIKLWTTDQREKEYQGNLRKKSYYFKGFR